MEEAYVTVYPGTPIVARFVRESETVFRVETDVERSITLHIPWQVERHGVQTLSTGTLIDRRNPYHLPSELARGMLTVLRNHAESWREIGLRFSSRMSAELHDANVALREALAIGAKPKSGLGGMIKPPPLPAVSLDTEPYGSESCDADPLDTWTDPLIDLDEPSPSQDEAGERALKLVLDVSLRLTDAFTDQTLAVRRRLERRFAVLLGALPSTGAGDPACRQEQEELFNCRTISLCWRDIEPSDGQFDWSRADLQLQRAQDTGLAILSEPLVSFDPMSIPQYVLERFSTPHDDGAEEARIQAIAGPVRRFVEMAVERYSGRFDGWMLLRRFENPWIEGLNSYDCVRIIEQLLDPLVRIETRREAGGSPVPELMLPPARMICIGQPWGEYCATNGGEGPFQWADALTPLLGSDTGVLLDVPMTHHRYATLPRPPLSFSQMLDLWSGLGAPLYVAANVPSSGQSDAQARFSAIDGIECPWTPRTQQEWVHRYLPLMLSKPFVRGFFWIDPCDAVEHTFPHGGLFDGEGRPKNAWHKLCAIRKAYLE